MKKKIVMADKSFEQRVQEELGSLKMRPDEGVWTKVEAGLNKEKKRRWIVWLFLFAALTGASFWVYFEGRETDREEAGRVEGGKQEMRNKETGETRNRETRNKTRKEETGEQDLVIAAGKETVLKHGRINADTEKKKIVEEIALKGGSRPRTVINRTLETGLRSPVVKEGTNEDATAAKKQPAVTEENKRLQTFTNVPPPEQTTAKTNTGVTGAALGMGNMSKEKQTPGTATATIAAAPKKETDPKEIAAVTAVAGKTETKETEQPGQEKNNIITSNDTGAITKTLLPKKDTKKKWQFSIVADAGRSALGNSLFSFFSISPAYSNYSPSNSVGTPGNPSAVANTPPETGNAFGFGFRFKADRILSKTFSIGMFGGYTLLQTGTTIGKLDSLSNSSSFSFLNPRGIYYTNSDSAKYTNRYHFLTIGSELTASFTLFKAIGARWQLGGGLNFLVGSNGLHYDNSSGRSFQNNDLLTHVLPYFSSGLDFAIGKRPFMYVGPHLQYNAGHLNKQSTSGDHLFFTSLQFSFILPGNKK
jgi:hypothetical protein